MRRIVGRRAVVALCILPCLVMLGCAGARMTTATGIASPERPAPMRAIAIAPGSGPFGEAVGVELFNAGAVIVDASAASQIVGRVGLREFEVTSGKGLEALRAEGVDGVLTVKSVDGSDGKPESASARVTDCRTGNIVAGVTWQNGWGGQEGSMADRQMRKGLSRAASQVAQDLLQQLSLSPQGTSK